VVIAEAGAFSTPAALAAAKAEVEELRSTGNMPEDGLGMLTASRMQNRGNLTLHREVL
jgi:hypothetical protein